MKTTLYVNYVETYSGGEICEGQENDDWPDHEDAYVDFRVTHIGVVPVTPYHETFEFAFEPPAPAHLFVVVVRYYDGDTFGQTCGYGSVEGVFLTETEAALRVTALKQGSMSVKGYNPWDGYFAGLTDVEAYAVPFLA